MLNLRIEEWETRFGEAVCDYYRTRTRLAMTEDQISTLISQYTESWRRQCREARERLGWKEYREGPGVEWGTGEDPELLNLIERRWKVGTYFNYLHWAWMQRTTNWGKSMDGVVNATQSFTNRGRTIEIDALATWFVNGSRNHGVGPVRAVFALDLDATRLTDYTIWFLDKANPEGRLYQDREEARPPALEDDWLFVFRMRESLRTREGTGG